MGLLTLTDEPVYANTNADTKTGFANVEGLAVPAYPLIDSDLKILKKSVWPTCPHAFQLRFFALPTHMLSIMLEYDVIAAPK